MRVVLFNERRSPFGSDKSIMAIPEDSSLQFASEAGISMDTAATASSTSAGTCNHRREAFGYYQERIRNCLRLIFGH